MKWSLEILINIKIIILFYSLKSQSHILLWNIIKNNLQLSQATSCLQNHASFNHFGNFPLLKKNNNKKQTNNKYLASIYVLICVISKI